MKPLLLITIVFLVQNAFGQYSIDPKVKREYDSLFKVQPKELQQKRFNKSFNEGFALLLNLQEDTLNIQDYKPYVVDTSLKIISIDENGNELPDPPKDTTTYNQWFSANAAFQKDTLSISSFFGLFSGLGFSVKIAGDKTYGDFFEYVRRDSIYRLQPTDQKSSTIQVKARTENMVLSNLPNRVGDVFYGKVTLVTDPFYADNDEFKSGAIHKRYTITYLFTCKLTDGTEN